MILATARRSGRGAIRRLAEAFLLMLVFTSIRAEAAPTETAPVDVCSWEVKYRERIGYEATPESKLVREVLAQPIEDNFAKAEYARWILQWTHRCDEARLLQYFMERNIIAEILGLPVSKARTVAEAIAEQRADPTPVSRDLRSLAWGKLGAEGLDRLEQERGIYLSSPEIHFGYPGKRNDSPRSMARIRLQGSTCLERGSCSYLSYFWQKGYVQNATSNYGYVFAYILVTAGVITLMFRRRTASQGAFTLSRLVLLVAAIHLMTVSAQVWTMPFTTGEGAAAGVAVVYFMQKGLAVAIAIMAVSLLALASWGSRADRNPD